ncbi:MAG: MATE family efflux transporter [Spirochaetaceae bacterium]|nr:MATE family efflux transporter [Spirochaetaceae bacterium]
MRKNTPSAPLFGSGRFYIDALALVVPVMLQSLVTSMVSLVDNFMVAGLGDEKMAAVNVANQINFVYFVLVNVSCMAGGIYLSQHRGAKNEEGMRQAFRFKLLASTAISAAYVAACLTFPEALLSLMLSGNAASGEIVREGAVYLRIVSITFVPIAISSATGSAYREIGQAKAPLVFSSTAALVNTFFNWVLIYGNLGAPRLEIAGAAIATDIARVVELGAFLVWTKIKRPAFAFKPSRLFALDRRLFAEILGKSGMIFFSETAWVVSETIIAALYNGRGGSETVAGMAAGWTIANLFFLIFGAIHTATSVILGSTLGAGRLDEARAKARWISSGAVALGAMGGLLAAVSTALVPIVFSNLSPEARVLTRSLVFLIGAYLPLWALLNAQFAISRSGGDTAMGVFVDVGGTYVLFVPAAFALAAWTSIGPVALFGIAKISDFGKAAIAHWWLRKERWVRNLAAPGGP